MQSNTKTKRLIFLFLLILTLALLCSCSGDIRAIRGEGDEQTVFMTVDGHKVYFEEIRYLAKNYISSATEEARNSEDFDKTLYDFVMHNAKKNAVLSLLCEEYDIKASSKEIKESVQDEINKMAEQAGTREQYKEQLSQNYMTDHYLRYYLSLSKMRPMLERKLYENDVIKADDKTVLDYIKSDNFIRTWHIYIGNDEGDDAEENYSLACDILSELKDGESMKRMIGRYSEDFSLTTLDGVYFTRGEYDMAYEDAAFSLDISEYSDVVCVSGGYYIIQRLEKEEEYINNNFETLKLRYLYVMLDNMLSEKAENAEIKITKFGEGINLSEIK